MFQVQWYPGHMTRAKRKIDDVIKTIDIIIELRDARIPWSSGNPDISRLALNKEHIIVLNKKDLAEHNKTEDWLDYFESMDIKALAIRGTDKQDTKRIVKKLEDAGTTVFAKRRKKGLLDRPIRCMVIGISNVGKSSFINSLAIKKVAVTGNKPGVTKGHQWVKVSSKIELLDTPGILWPKFDGTIGAHLALTGAISDSVYDIYEAAAYLLEQLAKKGYVNLTGTPNEMLLEFGLKRGLLVKGGDIDLEKAALLLLKDYRSGKLGPISLEWVSDYGINQ